MCGAGYRGHRWGIRGSDTQLWRQGRFFQMQNYIKKKVLIKNKQKIPSTHRGKKVLISLSKHILLLQKLRLRRYLYFKTTLITLLTVTRLPDSHLWPLDISAVCCEPSAGGLLSCASSGEEEMLRKQVRKASVWPQGSDPLHKALPFHVRSYVTDIDVAPPNHSTWSWANSLPGESKEINAS